MAYLKLIIGPMFSGKSTKLIELIRKYKVLNYKMMVIKNSLDKRYTDVDEIVSHNKDTEKCVCVSNLMDIFSNDELQLQFLTANVIFIEEAQFFPDLEKFVDLCLVENKRIFVVGLNGDSNMKNFGDIHKLLPKCDDIELLTAYCKKCKKETPAPFTKKLDNGDETKQIEVGESDIYEPLCRKHFHNEE